MIDPAEREVFVGFLDILGFREIIADWDKAREFWNKMKALLRAERVTLKALGPFGIEADGITLKFPEMPSVQSRIISDSFVIVADQPLQILLACASAQSFLLDFGIFCRGCIAHGRHIEENSDQDFLVVSEALARAYDGESRKAIYPRVILDASALAEILARTAKPSQLRVLISSMLIQSSDDMWMIDPTFSIPHLDMMVDNTRHQLSLPHVPRVRSKYEWFAEFLDFIRIWERLVPGYYDESEFRILSERMRGGASFLADPSKTPVAKHMRLPRFAHPTLARAYAGERLHPFVSSFVDNVNTYHGK